MLYEVITYLVFSENAILSAYERFATMRYVNDIKDILDAMPGVAVVPVQDVEPEAGEVKVLPAVIVDIGDADAHSPAFPRESCLFRDVLESPLSVA